MVTTVKDLMSKDVITVDPMTPMMDAVDQMLEKNVKSLVVPPKKETDAFGIVTFTDIAKKVVAEDVQVSMLNVFDIMSKPCISVRADLDVKYAAKLMTDLNISRVIVTDGNDLVGIISITDVVRAVAKDRK